MKKYFLSSLLFSLLSLSSIAQSSSEAPKKEIPQGWHLQDRQDSGYAGITVRYDRITPEEVTMAHHRGLQVCLFGAGGRWSHRTALRSRPDRLQTDDPVALTTRR